MIYEHYRSIGERYLSVGKEDPLFNFPLHLHKSFELIFVIEGMLAVQIGSRSITLSGGEAAFVYVGRPHSYSIRQGGKLRVAIFSEDFIPELKKEYSPKLKLPPLFFEKLDEAKSDIFKTKSLLYELASIYAKGEPIYDDHKDEEMICNIAAYIDRHFTENITLKQVATEFGYNPCYISSLINNHFGTSFPKVVNDFRIQLACGLLKQNNLSITEIASRCGFNTQRNFNRVFREITGKTPKEYKNEFKLSNQV